MATFNIHEAKTHFSRLVDSALAGEDIVIAKAGKPVAKLVSIASCAAPEPRRLGMAAGKFSFPDSFYDPLPDDLLAEFEKPLFPDREQRGRE